MTADPHPDHQLFAEQSAAAARALVEHLPKTDPLRWALVLEVAPPESHWLMLIDEFPDGSTQVRHPPGGPTINYEPLGRWYRVPPDLPVRVVVGQLSDADPDDPEPILDAGAVYIDGVSQVSLIDQRPTSD